MGFLDLFKKSTQPTTNDHSATTYTFTEDELKEYTAEVMAKTITAAFTKSSKPHDEKAREKREEEIALQQKGFVKRRDALEKQGINTSDYTIELVEKVARQFIQVIAPNFSNHKALDKKKAYAIDFYNLTKTGNVPKNVASGHFDVYLSDDRSRFIIGHINFMKDGEVNQVDCHLWNNRVLISVYFRRFGDAHRVTSIVKKDMNINFDESLYHDNNAEDEELYSSILGDALASEGWV